MREVLILRVRVVLALQEREQGQRRGLHLAVNRTRMKRAEAKLMSEDYDGNTGVSYRCGPMLH